MTHRQFQLDLPPEDVAEIQAMMETLEASSANEVLRRAIQDWSPPGLPIAPGGPRERVHMRLPERAATRLENLRHRTGLTYSDIASSAVRTFAPKVREIGRRLAASRSAPPIREPAP